MGQSLRGTTILLVKRNDQLAIAGDGQISLGDMILKSTSNKIRRFADRGVVAGFAGSTADALALFSRFEEKLEEYPDNLPRAVVELAKDWRTDKVLRHLEAFLVVGNVSNAFLISGSGDLIESDDGLLAIGSGGSYALAAARALLKHTEASAAQIAEDAVRIASEICVFTNSNITVEVV